MSMLFFFSFSNLYTVMEQYLLILPHILAQAECGHLVNAIGQNCGKKIFKGNKSKF